MLHNVSVLQEEFWMFITLLHYIALLQNAAPDDEDLYEQRLS